MMKKYSREEIEKKVIEIIAKVCGLETEDIHLGDTMMDDIGCDSIDRLEIEIHLEIEFAIQFNKDEMIGAGWTVRELCDFMELKL